MSQNLQGATGFTLAFNSGGLARATTASLVQIAAAINFAIAGRLYQKAITNNIPFVIEPGSGLNPQLPNSFVTLAAGESCAFGIFVDSAGAVTYAQGPIVQNGLPCPVPMPPAGFSSVGAAGGKVIVGALKVANTTNPFIPGTTLLSAAGVTDTYFNFAGHPGYPV